MPSTRFFARRQETFDFAGVVLLALVMVVPVLSRLFSVAALDRSQLLSILGLAFLPTLVIQMVKVIRDRGKS